MSGDRRITLSGNNLKILHNGYLCVCVVASILLATASGEEGERKMAETSAHKVARVILHVAHERGLPITNLKLQKLLYYSQAWYLAILNKPLFHERIEAWVHGPVVPPVFGEYKACRWHPLSDPGETTIEEGDPAWPIRAHIAEVMDAYANLTGPDLESLTHREDPWKKARNGIAQDASSNAIITHQSMIEFYGEVRRQSS